MALDKDDQLIELWKVQIEDLRNTKNRTFLITFYSLIIQAGIIQFVNMIREKHYICLQWRWIFLGISIIVATLTILLLCNFQKDMQRYRFNLIKYSRKMSVREIYKTYYKVSPGYARWRYRVLVFITLLFGMVVGPIFVVIYVFKFC